MDTNNITILMQSLTTLGVALIGYLGIRFTATMRRLDGNMQSLERNTNSKMDALLAIAVAAAKAEGVLQEKTRAASEASIKSK